MAAHAQALGRVRAFSTTAYSAPRRLAQTGVRSRHLCVAVRAKAADEGDFDYDLFTIGAGSGGVRASRFASNYGAKVAVCELPFEFVSSEVAGGVGGTCVLRGCVPKKLMVYASEYAEHFRDSTGFGWEERPLPDHSWNHFMEAKRKELMRLNNAYKNTLKGAKVDLIEGKGTVIDAHTVDVDGKRYKAKNILIAVGGKANKINIPGSDLCITSDEVLELPQRPNKITMIGGGYIAFEFAGIFKRFGSEVHVVYRQQKPLRGFDEEVREFVEQQYQETGLQLHQGWSPIEVMKQADGRLTLVLESKEGERREIRDNDQVLMATGRYPKTSGLGLENAGVKLGKKGEVAVDEYSRTNVPSIWAVGDVTDRMNLTPVALMEGMALAKTIVLDTPTKPEYEAIASAVFSHPNISTVGLTEDEAAEKYKNVNIFTANFRPMRNTISGNPLRSFMKVIVDADSDRVVGMHMVGNDAAEIMQGFAVALKMGMTKAQLDSTVGIHPTSAEELVTLRTPTFKIRDGKKEKC